MAEYPPKQVYWEDVSEGMEIPKVVKHPTPQSLVRYAGASGDFNVIHYNETLAKAQRLPGIIVHGALKNAYLGHLLTDFVGLEGQVKKYGAQYRGMDFPDEDLLCRGIITRKYEENGEFLADLEIWTENPRGEKTSPGYATVALPSRKAVMARVQG